MIEPLPNVDTVLVDVAAAITQAPVLPKLDNDAVQVEKLLSAVSASARLLPEEAKIHWLRMFARLAS